MSVRVQQSAQTREWITDTVMSTCASRKSPPSVRTLAWLGLAVYCLIPQLEKLSELNLSNGEGLSGLNLRLITENSWN